MSVIVWLFGLPFDLVCFFGVEVVGKGKKYKGSKADRISKSKGGLAVVDS